MRVLMLGAVAALAFAGSPAAAQGGGNCPCHGSCMCHRAHPAVHCVTHNHHTVCHK
jgi:hypothetical protein